jgi:hypothetical protein
MILVLVLNSTSTSITRSIRRRIHDFLHLMYQVSNSCFFVVSSASFFSCVFGVFSIFGCIWCRIRRFLDFQVLLRSVPVSRSSTGTASRRFCFPKQYRHCFAPFLRPEAAQVQLWFVTVILVPLLLRHPELNVNSNSGSSSSSSSDNSMYGRRLWGGVDPARTAAAAAAVQ